MERTPIPFRIAPLVPHPCGPGTPPGINPAFAGLAPGKGKVGYALLTRAPVAAVPDRSPARDAPRLACVRPVASVHPEPGSNSTLYNTIDLFLSRLPRNVRKKTDPRTPRCSFSYSSCILILSMISFSSAPGSSPKASAKVRTFSEYARNGGNFFQTFLDAGEQQAVTQRNADEKNERRIKEKERPAHYI